MSTLKDKFDNFQPQPDPKVWQSVSSAITRPRRRFIYATSTACALAAAAMILFVARTSGDKESIIQTQESAVQVSQLSESAMEQSNTVVNATDETVTAVKSVAEPVGQQPSTVNADDNVPAVKAITIDEKAEKSIVVPSQNYDLVPATTTVSMPTAPAVVKPNIAANQDNVAAKNDNAVSHETVISHESAKAEANKVSQEPKVVNDELVLFIPNAFSPDDMDAPDEVHHFRAYPNSEANLLSFEMYIYNRGGRQVFHTTDVQTGWDGTFKGQKQPMGTYVYVIQLHDAVKGLQHTKGTVTLIR